MARGLGGGHFATVYIPDMYVSVSPSRPRSGPRHVQVHVLRGGGEGGWPCPLALYYAALPHPCCCLGCDCLSPIANDVKQTTLWTTRSFGDPELACDDGPGDWCDHCPAGHKPVHRATVEPHGNCTATSTLFSHFSHVSQLRRPAHALGHVLPGAFACWVLNGACNPMVCPTHASWLRLDSSGR